jgi:hypothetical protein
MRECEKCGLHEATDFTTNYGPEMGKDWAFTCGNCDPMAYWVPIEEYSDPQTGWRGHLEEKNWFDPDIFEAMLTRYYGADQ